MALRQANQYSTEFIIGACNAATAATGVVFGFEASHVRIINDSGVPIHYSLRSTGAASTDDPELSAGVTLDLSGVIVSGLNVTTSSTTTSTAADGSGHRIVVAAFGGF